MAEKGPDLAPLFTVCPRCQTRYLADAYCRNCGHKLAKDRLMMCQRGHYVWPKDKFCPECGDDLGRHPPVRRSLARFVLGRWAFWSR